MYKVFDNDDGSLLVSRYSEIKLSGLLKSFVLFCNFCNSNYV